MVCIGLIVPLLMSSLLTKIGIVCTQVLQRENVFANMEPEICTKMLRHLSEKLAAKFLATTLGYYSMVKITHLNDAVSEIFELKARQWKLNHCYKKIRKGEKGKAKKKS